MTDEKKTLFLKPKFQLGEQVYQQMWGLRLYEDNGKPQLLTIKAVVYTSDDFEYSWDFPRLKPGAKTVIKYRTNYSDGLVDESQLFRSIQDFTDATKEEREAEEAAKAKKAMEEEVKKYKEAKLFVAEFESKMFVGD